MPSKAVLIVEDDDTIRALIVCALKAEGYSTLSAANDRIALELLLSLSPNNLQCCLILALIMPVMKGNALVEIIDQKHRNTLGASKNIIAPSEGSSVNPDWQPNLERIHKPFDR